MILALLYVHNYITEAAVSNVSEDTETTEPAEPEPETSRTHGNSWTSPMCWCPTCCGDGQRLLLSFALLLWCRKLLLQVLQLVFVLQQVSRLQLIDVQRQILTQDLNLKL